MRHEKYEQYEKYRVRIPLKWGGEYPGHSKAILNAISFRDGQEALLKNCPLYAQMWSAYLGTQDTD